MNMGTMLFWILFKSVGQSTCHLLDFQSPSLTRGAFVLSCVEERDLCRYNYLSLKIINKVKERLAIFVLCVARMSV